MDFKGHFALARGRCHPLTVLDDHCRYSVGLFACGDEQQETVRGHLIALFRRYGLPEALLCDNGSPWGGGGETSYTALEVWLMRVGVRMLHGASVSSADARQGRAFPQIAGHRGAAGSAVC